ncbi:zinc-dependent alcohol dehydrogenase [Anaeroselena agilis]|uniref:Zinc-binding dehydrogenase n=1 Tax=Anaeroselena agilis TaxID=3063788 RepID=A0ABU3P2H5_9FIRM|nr:zinc-binding dehydrogenase [Selenomonadales bacterium 4137-cl]
MQATKAALLTKEYAIGLVDRQLECGDDEVIVKNHLMGICGSDKSFYRGQLPPKTAEFRQEPKFPFYLGHESGGEVVEVGRQVREFKPGDQVMAFGWNNNFATYFKAKVFELEPVPEGLEMDIASLGEPVACAMYSGLHAGVQLGDTVAVMGGGFAGQIIAQCAKKKGAAKVIVIDVLDGKLQLAKKLGADIVINATADDPVQAVLDITGGSGADVVVEAAGSEQSINAATALLKHNGIFVWYSWITRPVRLDISRWHDDGIEFRNTCLVHHTRQERQVWTPQALRPVVQGLIDIKSLITHEFSLKDIDKAFQFVDKDDAAVKVVLRP